MVKDVGLSKQGEDPQGVGYLRLAVETLGGWKEESVSLVLVDGIV